MPCSIRDEQPQLAVACGNEVIGITAGLIRYYRQRLGGITGDMLGAMAEILESGLFLLVSIGGAG